MQLKVVPGHQANQCFSSFCFGPPVMWLRGAICVILNLHLIPCRPFTGFSGGGGRFGGSRYGPPSGGGGFGGGGFGGGGAALAAALAHGGGGGAGGFGGGGGGFGGGGASGGYAPPTAVAPKPRYPAGLGASAAAYGVDR